MCHACPAGLGWLTTITAAAGRSLDRRDWAHRVEQTSSHPHQCSRYATRHINTDWHIIPDKGLDTVFAVKWLAAGTTVTRSARSCEGTGPRHAAFHPDHPLIYVANELDSTLTTWSFNSTTGELRALDTVSVLPRHHHGETRAAGIVISPDGNSIYVSIRGHDTVVTLRPDMMTGLPAVAQWTSTQGMGPRFLCFGPDARTLYVVNENSHSIVELSVDHEPGRLKPTGRRIETGSQVCIVFGRIEGKRS